MQAESPDATVVPAATTHDVARALARHARAADVVHSHMTMLQVAFVAVRPNVRALFEVGGVDDLLSVSRAALYFADLPSAISNFEIH